MCSIRRDRKSENDNDINHHVLGRLPDGPVRCQATADLRGCEGASGCYVHRARQIRQQNPNTIHYVQAAATAKARLDCRVPTKGSCLRKVQDDVVARKMQTAAGCVVTAFVASLATRQLKDFSSERRSNE